jgi:tRNA pseudouridine55 synthase
MNSDEFPVFTTNTWQGHWPEALHGAFFVVNKPLGWSSFRVVGALRRLLNIKKVGHAGTLDPMADGVLIVGVGKATKLIDSFQAQEKAYRATIRFGASTASYDAETAIVETAEFIHITQDDLRRVLDKQFTGTIEQMPPIYSALKVNGVPAYKRARAGKPVELKSRQVIIRSIDIVSFDLPDVVVDVDCGKGTYIRSLAHDVGLAMGSRAHLAGLTRTGIGTLVLSSALDMTTLIHDLDPNGTTGLPR